MELIGADDGADTGAEQALERIEGRTTGGIKMGHIQDTEGETEGDSQFFLALHVETHDDVPGEDRKDKIHGGRPSCRSVSDEQLSQASHVS